MRRIGAGWGSKDCDILQRVNPLASILFLRVAEVLAQSSGRFAWKLPRYQGLGFLLHPWKLGVIAILHGLTWFQRPPCPPVQHPFCRALATGVPFTGKRGFSLSVCPTVAINDVIFDIFKHWGHKFIPPLKSVGFLCFPKSLHFAKELSPNCFILKIFSLTDNRKRKTLLSLC
jgi:hypothetical protein